MLSPLIAADDDVIEPAGSKDSWTASHKEGDIKNPPPASRL